MRINTAAIVGMGALGLLYGEHIQKTAGVGSVSFLMDSERLERYRNAEFRINGTVIEIAKKHGIPVPVNEKFYRIVRKREDLY